MNVSSAGISGNSEVSTGASAPMSPTQKMSDLFDQIDPSGSGSISQAQFQQAFQTLNPPPSFQAAGANSVWNELDPNGTGSVSKQDFVSTMTTLMKQLRGHHHRQGGGAGGVANSAAELGALGSSTAKSDGGAATGTLLDALA